MIFQPPENRLMLFRDGSDDLDLAVLGDPLDIRFLNSVETPFREGRDGHDSLRLPGVIEAGAKTVYNVQLALAASLDPGKQAAQCVIPDFVEIVRVPLEPGNEVVIDRVQIIFIRGGRQGRLNGFQPFFQVGDGIDPLADVLLDPEGLGVGFTVILNESKELLGDLFAGQAEDLSVPAEVALVAVDLMDAPLDVVPIGILPVLDPPLHAKSTPFDVPERVIMSAVEYQTGISSTEDAVLPWFLRGQAGLPFESSEMAMGPALRETHFKNQ